jgi:AcrR family transcriptional regulator
MKIPLRTARALADDKFGPPPFTPRQREREAKIIALATDLMARHGKDHITMGHVAHALRIHIYTLRWHFSDLDSLLHEILSAHLTGIARAFSEVPHEAPDRQAQLRAIFHRHTRKPWGGFTEAHLLLIRERFTLPSDLLESIEATYKGLGMNMAGDWFMDVLAMLDTDRFELDEIEARLSVLTHPPRAEIPPRRPFRRPNMHHVPPDLAGVVAAQCVQQRKAGGTEAGPSKPSGLLKES